MSIISDFTKDPCEFLEQNIVLQMVAGTGVVGDTDYFTLRESAKKGFFTDGKACPVYEMHRAAEGERFKAYWCPYEDEKVRAVTLAGEAELMFTAKMTGCSFGVGMPAIDGSVRVAHSNLQETTELNQIGKAMYNAFNPKDPTGSQNAMAFLETKKQSVKTSQQGALLQGPLGVNGPMSTEINPANYRGLISTTFGIRGPYGDWRFYFHVFMQTGQTFTLYGVFPFPNRNSESD